MGCLSAVELHQYSISWAQGSADASVMEYQRHTCDGDKVYKTLGDLCDGFHALCGGCGSCQQHQLQASCRGYLPDRPSLFQGDVRYQEACSKGLLACEQG